MSFALDSRLAAATLAIGDLKLSRALLMNDARYPWLILVPRREGLSEIVDLDPADRAVLIEEIAAASAFLRGGETPTPGLAEIADAFRLTGYFLDRDLFSPRGLPLPDSRRAFLAAATKVTG